jgi:hypothetical protein
LGLSRQEVAFVAQEFMESEEKREVRVLIETLWHHVETTMYPAEGVN